MTEFTKGPWEVSGCRSRIIGDATYHVVGPNEEGWVAAVTYSGETDEQHLASLADARLIAAAPEMYEALKEIRERCLFVDDDGTIRVTEDPHIDNELFSALNAAIKHAEGKDYEQTITQPPRNDGSD